MGLVFIVVPDVFPHGLHLSELGWAVKFITPWVTKSALAFGPCRRAQSHMSGGR